jgi:hypothetical protein
LGCEAAAPDKLTVADVFKALTVDESRLEFSDEPPGKLQEVACEAVLRDTKVKVRVRIEVDYTVELFSETRQWDLKAVRAATVRKVTITPIARDS